MASSGSTFAEVIGSGAFGVVFLIRARNGKKFALKKIKLQDESKRQYAEQEVEVLKELRHDFVVAYVENWREKNFYCILTEYCAGGDLGQFLRNIAKATEKPVPEDLLLVWLWQMACGLEYMHKHESGRCILHRDLKPSNVYLTGDGTVRLGDMGIAKVTEGLQVQEGTICGTLPYMSPELLSGKPYCAKTDVWGLGCCAVEMASLEMAFEAASDALLLLKVFGGERPSLPESYDKRLDDLVGKLLCKDVKKRLSSSEVLEHPLMKKVEIDDIQPIEQLERHDLKQYLALHCPRKRIASDISLGPTQVTVDRILTTDPLRRHSEKQKKRQRGRVLTTITDQDTTVVCNDWTVTESELYSTGSSMSSERSSSASAPDQETYQAKMLRKLSQALTQYLGKEKVDLIVVLVKTSSNSRELMSRLRDVLGDGETQTRMIAQAATYMVLLEATINSRGSRC